MRAVPIAIALAATIACHPGPDGTGPVTTRPTRFEVALHPAAGVAGTQVVNFAVPLPAGLLADPDRIQVSHRGVQLASARVPLATYRDGTLRAVQLQVELFLDGAPLEVEVGTPGGLERTAVPVADTLVGPTQTPRVWATLPADWLAASGGFGPLTPWAAVRGTPLDAWIGLCDYARWGTDAFVAGMDQREVWLFDRVTAMYRGYAVTGDLGPLTSAYREAAIYRAGLTGVGADTRIGVPTAADDLKYHYTQGLALHYLVTGDTRYREAAEQVALRAHALWPTPGYRGDDRFWTERHAGFALLAYEHAARVSDDQAATFAAWADEAVAAYLAHQDEFPANGAEPDARCFAHTAAAHDEPFGYVGCSPWMSAILADGLAAYADRVGGLRADRAVTALIKLGRMIARHGRDATGKPYYWLGVERAGEVDEFDEHWGEAAYLVALAWSLDGRRDPALRAAADALVAGLRAHGTVGPLRSFAWQCRSAVATPAYLR
ncbi:MAG: hypothetical protein R3B06_27610 [Kofleriaceae bacterium]